MELDPGVQYLVDRLGSSIGPELKVIEDKDWSALEGDKLRKAQKIQKLLTERNIDHATKLYTLAKEAENLHEPQVKDILKKVVRLVELYEERYEVFYGKNDWAKYMEDDDSELDDQKEAELSYQSSLLDTLIEFRQKTLKFDLSNTKEKIHVPSYSKTPIPFGMMDAVLVKYVEVKEFLDRRREEYNNKKANGI